MKTSSDELSAHEQEHLHDLMLEFVLTGKRAVLAEYLERGGQLDEEQKDAILLALLKDEFRADNKGGKNNFESFKIYVGVKMLMSQQKISKTAACAEYAETVKVRTPRAIEMQFNLGEKIACEFNKK